MNTNGHESQRCRAVAEAFTTEATESTEEQNGAEHRATLNNVRGSERFSGRRSAPCWLAIACLIISGCSSTRPLRPGTSTIASTAPGTGAQFNSSMKQPENPAQSAAQNFERTTETELPLPAGTRVREVITTPVTDKPSAPPMVREKTVILAEPVVQKTRTFEKAGTTVGAAQKDTAREIGAKLSSLKGIVWMGVAMILFGIGSLAYPPLRAVIGSVTTSVAILAGGFALVVLPSLIVGNELLILGGVAATVGLWFLGHRHGNLRAKARTP